MFLQSKVPKIQETWDCAETWRKCDPTNPQQPSLSTRVGKKSVRVGRVDKGQNPKIAEFQVDPKISKKIVSDVKFDADQFLSLCRSSILSPVTTTGHVIPKNTDFSGNK